MPSTTLAPPQLAGSADRWRLAALLAIGMVLLYGQRGALSLAAPSIMKDLGLSAGVMGVLLSAFSWSYALTAPAAGWATDRFGLKRTYGLSFIGWSLASAATAAISGLAGLLLLRVAMGVSQAVAFPGAARAVAGSFSLNERGSVTAVYLTGVRLGQALIGGLSVWLLAPYGWRVFFLVTGLVPLLWVVPWWAFWSKWEHAPHQRDDQRESAQVLTFPAALQLLRRRNLFGACIGYFAYMYVWNLYITWLPGYLVIERNFTTREMGLYSSLPYVVMSAATLLSGISSDWLIRRGFPELPVRKAFICAGLAIAALIVPGGIVEDKMLAVWLFTASLAGLGIAVPNTWTLIQAICDKNIVGSAGGLHTFAGNIGAAIAPATTGFLADATGSFAIALGVSGPILAAGILSYWFVVRRA